MMMVIGLLRGLKEPMHKKCFTECLASLVVRVKNLPAMQEILVRSPGWEDSPEKGMATHSTILPVEFHRQRSLVGYRPWSHKELDMTKQLSLSR